jgi:hypothetical protein
MHLATFDPANEARINKCGESDGRRPSRQDPASSSPKPLRRDCSHSAACSRELVEREER